MNNSKLSDEQKKEFTASTVIDPLLAAVTTSMPMPEDFEAIANTEFFAKQNKIAEALATPLADNIYKDSDGIVLLGKIGTGKTTILEKVITDKSNIFYPDTIDQAENIISKSSEYFIALDEVGAFSPEAISQFIDLCLKFNKKFILSVQTHTVWPAELSTKVFLSDLKVTTLHTNWSI